jgi:hypothetical protein
MNALCFEIKHTAAAAAIADFPEANIINACAGVACYYLDFTADALERAAPKAICKNETRAAKPNIPAKAPAAIII